MGFGGIGIWQLLIILAIVVLLFGTKRLGSIGSDLGKAIKGFKKSVSDDDAEKDSEQDDDSAKRNVEDKTDPNSAQTQQEKSAAEDKNRS
ncbi:MULTISPECIES: twin-arginine translocase TatA/TatE family subunit [unclassified Marinimicrobium]|jgi:sec-independent protein translocase protein TatA|uniref:twin-arginine translocase TatA/TatE family subunit n=1 Tax=unclassified Marinimicrobium TaxID=2632100 RepID=UPI000C4EEBD4|nr:MULTISPECIES: twin-arginine translocase TatA/TatE family subunit [unclassified Marinimicrobium]MAN51043.1 twin-arginine translocase subunit TatA [Marinimicrobium sp.]|tara:strand:+ start:220 stop:489 length:270 start_codon:yes stop_codon:yes gene_type:complete